MQARVQPVSNPGPNLPNPLPGYEEAVQWLYNLRWAGVKFGLENTRHLAALAGNPQDSLRIIHVAGTNGKGSTSAWIENIVRAAGHRAGLYTSPHLLSFRERIQVDRNCIDEASVARLTAFFQNAGLGRIQPTFFEVVTVMALRHFADRQCAWAVLETGLGGRLDATNIVNPIASVITNVSLDHQDWLGQSLHEIASEKAGIIKPGIPVFTAADDPVALEVIRRTAEERGAPLHVISRDRSETLLESLATRGQPRLTLPLEGSHQRRNAALAIAVARSLDGPSRIGDDAIRLGIATLAWPGRFERIPLPHERLLVLDGAHNTAGAIALRHTVSSALASQPLTLILGILNDKDLNGICQALAPLASLVLTVPVQSERSVSPETLAASCAKAAPGCPITPCASLRQALEIAEPNPCVLVTGSLYLVGEAKEILANSTPQSNIDRPVTEWIQHHERPKPSLAPPSNP